MLENTLQEISKKLDRNPYLPEAPADGKHDFQGPADLGGNRRCTFCGAYRGSVEGERPCYGEFRESGKMRVWAAQKWAKDRLASGGPLKKLVCLVARTPAPKREVSVLWSHGRVLSLQLECGHERAVDLDEYGAAENGHAEQVGCVACALLEGRD